ncbi:hypothetical protein PTNB73_05367 [Pyrenophora teres f. teres]|uniref:Integral membrane protein n=1 Tax=Pyrenophora teres f. teres TaxID=97479 RepID=A0A6S6VZR6_9PLEO|nr:hypothetical protein HRS9139_05062 [Pyrenophora teres f. teres]KAE8840987.1 hypothetical protein PTNB85_04386 [Pyrenophora teres f. teres]KAE8848875.1 hypothetical protein HRS9122_02891 [Pyrenophora teres f. teres]KAE8867273.1 hypothetical protein PTNB73_05367 [Pyrenophora teres f. teres]CAE7030860.1 integral membrane protein [Pyrenophora teres f. teres]
MTFTTRAVLLNLATTVCAQYGPNGQYGPGGYGGGGDDDDGGDDGNSYASQYGGEPEDFSSFSSTSRHELIIAHGVLAALAFVLLFPVGSILIRLGSFRGVWIIHGLFQLFAYVVYIAAFGIGVWMINNIPVDMLSNYHPIIGITVFALLFFQPILGFIHHLQFKKYSRRTVWSHGHLWLGRFIITLGMINGGLGLLLASGAPDSTGHAPSRDQIIAYGVIAGIMWLLWAAAAIHGERKKVISSRAAANKEVETGAPRHPNDSKAPFARRVYI